MPTTEICIVPMVPNANVGDPQAEGAKTFKAFTDTLGQQPGMQGIKFGMQHETADTLQVFIGKFVEASPSETRSTDEGTTTIRLG